MSLRNSQISVGKLVGVVYDFDSVGDVLPMHSHPEGQVHISIIARGKFKATGDGWEMEMSLGEIYDWEAEQAHEFVALEPNSRMVNIIK